MKIVFLELAIVTSAICCPESKQTTQLRGSMVKIGHDSDFADYEASAAKNVIATEVPRHEFDEYPD